MINNVIMIIINKWLILIKKNYENVNENNNLL
jgi:hypothetical protein